MCLLDRKGKVTGIRRGERLEAQQEYAEKKLAPKPKEPKEEKPKKSKTKF